MLVARLPLADISVLSLRAKVSHSWLDHEVAMVPTSLAVNRWRAGQWAAIALRWKVLHKLALELADALADFGAATLVDRIDALAAIGTAGKCTLRERLVVQHASAIDVDAQRRRYLGHLHAFWESAMVFFGRTSDATATVDCISKGWEGVRTAGSDFKRLFEDGTIPEGIVLP